MSHATYARRPIKHGIIGGAYLFETGFNYNLHGFEIGLNKHYSCCVDSHYLNSFGVSFLTGNNLNEFRLSYTSSVFRKVSGGGHGGWNLICRMSPFLVQSNQDYLYGIKPGIGLTLYTGARTSAITFQVFALYNYRLWFQKDQTVNGMNNHTLQLGVFVGFNAIEMRPENKRKKLEDDEL